MAYPVMEKTRGRDHGKRLLPHQPLYRILFNCLKGQCHEIFCFWFFSCISFPQAPEYTIRAVLHFFENLRRYLQLKVDHRYQQHRWQICHRCQRHPRQNFATSFTSVVDTDGKFVTGVNDTGSKFAAGVVVTGGKQWD
jgi:hypothetical protein